MRLLLALLLTFSTLASTTVFADAKEPPADTPATPLRPRVMFAVGEVTQRGAAFDVSMLQRMTNTRRSAMTACYERALRTSTAFQGRITFAFSLDASGAAHGVSVVSNATGNADVANCMMRVLQGFRFNPGPDGDASFTLPFDLSLVP